MGVLGLTTPNKVRNFSEFPEVKGKNDPQLQPYIDRAESQLDSLYDYDTAAVGYVAQMELAANLLTENIIILMTPDFRRSQLAGYRAETIGTYSYTRSNGGSVGQQDMLGMTDEILRIIRRFVLGKVLKQSRTEVFVPRTVKVDESGVKYYVDEDASSDAITDPTDPRHHIVIGPNS